MLDISVLRSSLEKHQWMSLLTNKLFLVLCASMPVFSKVPLRLLLSPSSGLTMAGNSRELENTHRLFPRWCCSISGLLVICLKTNPIVGLVQSWSRTGSFLFCQNTILSTFVEPTKPLESRDGLREEFTFRFCPKRFKHLHRKIHLGEENKLSLNALPGRQYHTLWSCPSFPL